MYFPLFLFILTKYIHVYHFKASLKLQSNLDGPTTDGSFPMANSNSFLSPYEILPIAQENKYLRKFSYREIVCSVYSLESSLRGNSNEYTQHTITV